MNIFVIDSDPTRSAQQLLDKHVVKMPLESAQMLSTARRLLGDTSPSLYKQAFQNHPCTIWVRQTNENYQWLLTHFVELCKEYTYRYGREHACFKMIHFFHKPLPNFPSTGLKKFATAMPDQYKVEDPIQSYRNYYLGEKMRMAKWTQRPPEFLDDWLRIHTQGHMFK